MPARRVLGVWLLLAFVMSLNGVFREAALVPVVKRTAADILSAVLGISIILAVTRPFLRPFYGRPDARPATVAVAWAALTLAFEFLFGHYVDQKSWSELVGNYALWRGKLWPVVFASVIAAPFLWTRWLTPRRPRGYRHGRVERGSAR